jgi:hypothetical protein
VRSGQCGRRRLLIYSASASRSHYIGFCSRRGFVSYASRTFTRLPTLIKSLPQGRPGQTETELLIPSASPGDPREIARIAVEDDSILGDDRQLLEVHVNSWRLQGDAHVYGMVAWDVREVRGLRSPLAQSARVVLLLRIFRRARVSLYLYRSP